MNVELVRWPAQLDRRERLRSLRQPRILLIEGDVPAPLTPDPLEDWVRLPVERADLNTRMQALAIAAEHRGDDAPTIDEWGVLRFCGRQATLPPLEARLARPLVQQFRSVISRDELSRVGWPEGAPGRNALDVHILRVRRRIEPVGLVIRTLRSRGYLVDAEARALAPLADPAHALTVIPGGKTCSIS